MYEFKVRLRCDQSEVFETDDVVIKAETLLEAARIAHETYELHGHAYTVISIERRI